MSLPEPSYCSFKVCQYNVLAPAYATKWREREGCLDHEAVAPQSNWPQRLPALQRLLASAAADVYTLQELQRETLPDVQAALTDHLVWFTQHPGRKDGLAIAYRAARFKQQDGGQAVDIYQDTVATARLDLVDKDSGLVIRVVATHQKGYQEDQLAQALAHAAAGNNADATLVCGDFNEEFSLRQWPMGYATLGREADLPAVSRPPHKVQKQVDYIFVSTNVTERVRALHIGRDDDSFDAILDSHEVCETGDMPSDHGIEALTVEMELSTRPSGTTV